MRRQMWLKAVAVVLAVVLCAAPFFVMRHVGRRLPDNPIPTEPETAMQTQPAIRPQTGASFVSDAPDQTAAPAAGETRAAAPAAPQADVPADAKLQADPLSAAFVPQSADSGSANNYGFSQNGSIAAAAAVTNAAKPSPEPVTKSDEETATSPAQSPAEETAYAYVPPAEPKPHTEQDAKQPKLATDLAKYAVVRQGELTDDTLRFFAYGTDGENLSVQVRVKESASAGSPSLLRSADGRNYVFSVTLGKTYTFYVTLLQSGASIAPPAVYSVSYRATLADRNTPRIGTGISLSTNLDHLQNGAVTESPAWVLKVTARTLPDWQPIYANEVQVKLNGIVLQPVGGSTDPEYDLQFLPADDGGVREYTLEVLAWHGDSSAYWWRTIEYRAVPDGTVVGHAHLSLDATTLGLCSVVNGTVFYIEEADVPVVMGETAAHAVLRFLDTFGFTNTHRGTAYSGFYLESVSRTGLCDGLAVPDDLKEMLRLDGVQLRETPSKPDTIGEKYFTAQSGWEFVWNGIVYERGLSAVALRDGDRLSLRFTLALGKDIGALPVEDSRGLKSYCGIWADGTYTPLSHVKTGEPVMTESGEYGYVCANCKQIFIPGTEEDHEIHAQTDLYLPDPVFAAQRLFTRRVQ